MKNILLLSALFSLLFSAVHRVPHDRETIQDGVNAASTGDTVLVDDGIYFENVLIDKEITLASYYLIDGDLSHRDATIIDGSDYDYMSSSYGGCVLFRSPYSGDLIYPQLIGFTIQNGTGTRVRETIQTPTGEDVITYYMGGGIMVDHCAPIVNYNRIRNNGVQFVGTGEQRGAGTQRGGGSGFNNSDDVEFDEDIREGSARFILRDHHDIDFSWNEWDNNFADDGNTLGSLDFTGDFDMSNSEFDYFSDEFEDVYDYWVDEGDAFTDFTNSFGEPAIDDSDVFIDGSTGNDTTNTGITPDSPFSTIEGALSKIYGNESNPRNIFMAGGNYSPSRDGAFPVRMTSHISLSGDDVEFDEDRDYTVIDPGGTGRAFLIEDVENVSLSNMKIIGGSATEDIGFGGLGGGVLVHESDPLLKNLIIESNEASIFGGGLCFVISTATLVDVDILNNTAPGGAGIFMYSSDLNMVNVNIQENQGEEGDLDNTPYTVGAGLLMDRSNPLLNGVMITGNVADYAGGIWLGNSEPIMTNVTIANNTATGHNYFLENYGLDVYGGGLGMWNSFPLITNSIVYDNTPDPLVSFFESQPVIAFSNVEGGSLDNGNIDLPPLFNEDFSLGEGSPCIDSGNPNPIYFDIGDESVADMGATGGSRLLFNFNEFWL